ncbi:gem-associated protein 7 [Guaruba guarouba]
MCGVECVVANRICCSECAVLNVWWRMCCSESAVLNLLQRMCSVECVVANRICCSECAVLNVWWRMCCSESNLLQRMCSVESAVANLRESAAAVNGDRAGAERSGGPMTPAEDAVPVPVLRLPRGPDGRGRGFEPRRGLPRAAEAEAQRARALLRARFLRALAAARGRPARFWLRAGVRVDATFGAAEREAAALLVEALRTPLGLQGAALLRGSDLLGFRFALP